MLHREFPDAFVGVGKGEAVGGLGMGKAGGIEIESEARGFCPVNPIFEMGAARFRCAGAGLPLNSP